MAHRTGDHTDHSWLWASIGGDRPANLTDLTSLDVAPLIADLLLEADNAALGAP